MISQGARSFATDSWSLGRQLTCCGVIAVWSLAWEVREATSLSALEIAGRAEAP